jgi:hypothetical protein
MTESVRFSDRGVHKVSSAQPVSQISTPTEWPRSSTSSSTIVDTPAVTIRNPIYTIRRDCPLSGGRTVTSGAITTTCGVERCVVAANLATIRYARRAA